MWEPWVYTLIDYGDCGDSARYNRAGTIECTVTVVRRSLSSGYSVGGISKVTLWRKLTFKWPVASGDWLSWALVIVPAEFLNAWTLRRAIL